MATEELPTGETIDVGAVQSKKVPSDAEIAATRARYESELPVLIQTRDAAISEARAGLTRLIGASGLHTDDYDSIGSLLRDVTAICTPPARHVAISDITLKEPETQAAQVAEINTLLSDYRNRDKASQRDATILAVRDKLTQLVDHPLLHRDDEMLLRRLLTQVTSICDPQPEHHHLSDISLTNSNAQADLVTAINLQLFAYNAAQRDTQIMSGWLRDNDPEIATERREGLQLASDLLTERWYVKEGLEVPEALRLRLEPYKARLAEQEATRVQLEAEKAGPIEPPLEDVQGEGKPIGAELSPEHGPA